MRKKALQDLANVFCQMFVGWRMQEDLQLLIDAGSCSITIDVVTGTAFLDDTPTKLHIAEEISAWFKKKAGSAEHSFRRNRVCQFEGEPDFEA